MSVCLSPVLSSLVDHVCSLCENESSESLRQMLEGSSRLFVEKYWFHMSTIHIIELREKLADDGFYAFYSRKIRNINRKETIEQRNQRFVTMKALVDKGEFFTLGEMKTRDPVLYDELVGQFLSNDDMGVLARREYNNYQTASQMLMGQIDNMRTSELYYSLIAKEGEAGRPTPDEEFEDEDDKEINDNPHVAPLSSVEKELMEREFISQMELKFLNGTEGDLCKLQSEKSSSAIAEQDNEDAYFDSEDAEKPAVQHVDAIETDDDYMTMDLSKFS